MPAAVLQDRSTLRLAGKDTLPFLHGLVTRDVETLAAGAACYAALLSPQGKILCDFFIFRPGDETDVVLIDAPTARAADLLRRLTAYKLRAAIDLRDVSETFAVAAAWPDAAAAPDFGRWFVDPRKPGAGLRGLIPRGETRLGGDPRAYAAHRIALELPEGGVDFAYEDAFPHEIGLELLDGVSFKKGCYVGQEVVSRMHHRGGARTRLSGVRFDGAAPPVGSEIRAGDRLVGKMGSSFGSHGLAMLRTDRLQDAIAAGDTLRAADVPLRLATTT